MSWDWWDAWKSGDPDESKRALDAETDRSLARDPGRWSWRSSDDVEPRHPRESHRTSEHRRHHTGKGHVSKGQSDERTLWSNEQWDAARADYERQNMWNNDRADDRPENRGWFW